MADTDKDAARRFQEQCILMAKWKSLVQHNQDKTVVDLSAGPTSGTPYKNFVAIDHAKPFEFMNLLFKKSDNSELLLSMTNEQLSLLVPQLQIFKYYKSPGSGQELILEMPFEDFMSKSAIDKITSDSAGRGSGAGIKSFEWTSLGKQEAEKYQFGAELVIHLQGVEELFETRRVDYLPTGEKIEMKYSDLILHRTNGAKTSNEGSRVWDPEYFRVKVVVGWHIPELASYKKLLGTKLIDTLNEHKQVLYMILGSHELDFQEDGSIDLKISFTGGEEVALSDPETSNILIAPGTRGTERKRIQNRIKGFEKRLAGLASRDEPSQATAPIQDLLEKEEKKLADLGDVTREEIYSRVIGRLLEGGYLKSFPVKKTFFKKELSPKGAKLEDSEVVDAGREFNRRVEEEIDTSSIKTFTNISYVRSINEEQGGLSDFFDRLFKKENDPSNVSGENIDRIQRRIDDIDDNTVSLNEDEHLVVYFYLGDLIELVLEGMFLKSETSSDDFFNKSLRILLGPISFLDYGSIEQVPGLSTRREGLTNEKDPNDDGKIEEIWRGEFSSVNIADIPISLTVFINWFNKSIVDSGSVRYSFKKFLSSMIQDLVIRAVSHQCYDYAPEQQARVSYKTFSLPKNEERESLFLNGRVELDSLMGGKAQFKVSGRRATSEKSDLDSYVLIYGIKEAPYDLHGNYHQDLELGIYHIYYGDERGLVKKIKFNKKESPSYIN